MRVWERIINKIVSNDCTNIISHFLLMQSLILELISISVLEFVFINQIRPQIFEINKLSVNFLNLHQIWRSFYVKFDLDADIWTFWFHTCIDILLRWTILIGSQIVFNIEKLIDTIWESITGGGARGGLVGSWPTPK
jgi:hypothetical protein